MQMELYGKELECRTPLGVESSYLHPHGTVKNEQMTASSAHADHPAHQGRRQHFSAWCADPVILKDPFSAKSQYLQIDFLMLKNITAVATEGFSSSFVTDFYVYYATDEGAFHSLREREGNEKVLFSGYTGHLKEPHYNWFYETPFLARYVRINPQHWNDSMCLRVEFLGCDAVTFPLGMEFGILSNDQITASSEEATNRKNCGRLNNAGWCASRELLSSNPLWKELYHYLQIDLLQPRLICSVATQGKETKNPEERSEAVTSFYLKYSFKGDEWFRYHRLLVGEYYGNSVMRYWLDPSVAAKFIQFNPQSSWSPLHVCMRVEIYSCVLQGDLSNYLPLGMESFRISDAQLSASSEADASHSAVCSRLNHHIQGGAWIPAKSDRSEYLQIDLEWITILTGIATQGHPEKTYRTLAFKIRYGISLYEGTVKDYPKEFDGNVQEGSTVYDSIKPTRCRYVRICPLSWSEKVGLRAELYGYEADHFLNRLGLKSPSGHAFFSASSSAKFSLPGYGYLHSGLGTGAWCAEVQDVNQFLQVDLKGETIITGVVTQGQKYFDSWVLSFTLAYSSDERAWHGYSGVGFVSQVLSGNKDRDTAVLHFFEVPLMARYLRFLPQKWKNRICMRVEIYGCALKVAVCAKCSSDAKCIKDNYDRETCFCKHGYFGDGIQCTDRDECSSSINPCPENADCSNTVGSYLCNCKQGFVNDGYNCIDIDECLDPNRCPHSGGCINTPGSFTCDCGAGIAYDIQSQSCNDIDECSTGSFKCNSLASCVNTHGSYTCFCAEGYTGHGRVSCIDVNECHRDPRICPGDTVCENTRGSYICVCQTGYVWKDSKCQDVDECSDKKSQCPLDADCANTIGSYMCNCKPGFIINGPYCIDYNECLSNRHNCDVNAWCTNTAGSYKCFCKEGYHGNGFTCEKDGG